MVLPLEGGDWHCISDYNFSLRCHLLLRLTGKGVHELTPYGAVSHRKSHTIVILAGTGELRKGKAASQPAFPYPLPKHMF